MPGLNRIGYDSVADAWDAARVGFYGRERDYLDAFLADLGFAPVLHEFMNAPTSGRDKGRYAIVARKR